MVQNGIKYVNLLENDGDNKYHSSVGRSDKSSKRRTYNRTIRALYTEDEALGIACMSINQICSSYKVNYTIAYRMRMNARKYHDILDIKDDKNESHGVTGLAKMIDDGATLEECLQAYPIRYSARIKDTYAYKKNNTNITSADELNEFVNNLVAIGDYDTIIRLENLSIDKLAIELQCSRSDAFSIGIKMRDILFKNIYYAAGMKMAYSDNFDAYIKGLKDSNDLEARSVVARYKICKALKCIYEETYDNHHNILVGIDSVPEEAMAYKDQYLSLLYNRFNKQPLRKSRVLNSTKKAALNNDDILNVSIAFMIDIHKSKGILYRFHRNGGGGK